MEEEWRPRRKLLPIFHGNTGRGTPRYQAPEVFAGEYTTATDVWALGVMLLEMVTGKLVDQVGLGLRVEARRSGQREIDR